LRRSWCRREGRWRRYCGRGKNFMSVIAWLKNRQPEFGGLPDEDISQIIQFTLAWSYFESTVLDNNAGRQTIENSVNRWNDEELLTEQDFRECIEYFGNRYFRGDNHLNLFRALRFRRNDGEDYIRQHLGTRDSQLKEQVTSILLVIYRLRNNLFHGYKWAYGIRGQQENFRHANIALIAGLETHSRLQQP